MADAATLYDKSKKPADKGGKGDAAPAKKVDDAKAEDAKPADDAGKTETPNPMDAAMADFKAMNKRQETERRDAHGNHRELLRTMAGRHEKEIADMMDKIRVSGTPAPAGAGGSEGAQAEEA